MKYLVLSIGKKTGNRIFGYCCVTASSQDEATKKVVGLNIFPEEEGGVFIGTDITSSSVDVELDKRFDGDLFEQIGDSEVVKSVSVFFDNLPEDFDKDFLELKVSTINDMHKEVFGCISDQFQKLDSAQLFDSEDKVNISRVFIRKLRDSINEFLKEYKVLDDE